MADAAAPKVKKAKKPAAKPTHAPYSTMIVAAVTALKERGGSSRQAILKYVIANNKIGDEKKAAVRVRLALVKAVTAGKLKQVKGKGASGSFKLHKEEAPKKAKKPAAKKAAKKPAAKKAVKKPAAKKSPKKAAKKPAAKKTPKKAAKKPAAKKPAAKKAAKKPAAKKAAKK